ncbi:hypothetical protein HN51_065852 [Arachis hypogaea]|uniref:Peptidase A1 domain-containing protein n=1 Tax=Arachis hypogaea TaxID=3818 RepID=A0A444ZHT7_ARAHY|nr:aspartic proteinase CDR1 [Arachis ipaensis]XP_025646836.1 aspartic proteinase CDR1 [Arachis hypogaea]RYR13777.1 hypothetical protein Ahy_B04g070593 isoform B [Arachis hypogaea]
MALVHETLILLLLTFSTWCFSTSISTNSSTTTSLAKLPNATTAKPKRLVTKLIHQRSVHHPHYNQSETAKERIELDIQHSIARVTYLHARIEGTMAANDHRTQLSPSSSGRTIMANISVGQPPTPQLVVMDTASEIFWIMCNPCSNCDQHLGQLFDPSKSSTYTQLCRTPCGFRGCNCHPLDRSPFSITYADNSSASGTLAYETLVFETSDEGSIQIPNIEFGCGRDIVYNNDPGYNGILGLNNAPMSLASQIGHKFSYCIGSLADKSSNYNQLILGEGADLEGYPTHFQALRGMYYITMEGISIGERRLDIAPATFEIKENGAGGVIIDTGSTLTYLPDDVQNLLYKEVRNILGGSFRKVIIETYPWLYCHLGVVSRDLVGFPVVTFHFAQGADLALDTGSFFEQLTDSVFCMAIGPVSATGLDNRSSVIGLLAQQSYNVGYDLVNQIVYFQRIDCQLLSG